MYILRQNTATRIPVGPFIDATDAVTPEVALTVTGEQLTLVGTVAGVPTLLLDASATASGGSNDMVHVTGDDAGMYDLELAAANVNFAGVGMLSINSAEHGPVFHSLVVFPAAIYDWLFGVADLQTITKNPTQCVFRG